MNNARTTPKDFFLHLGAAIALYTAAAALINLALSIIDYLLPDKLAGYFYAGSVFWPISILVVVVPILYILEWLINRDTRLLPEKKDVWIRRWRIFLTLFLAAALIIGDLIALLNTYFNGEITGRFVWKVAAILVIAAVAGKYYFFSMYDSFRRAPMARKFCAWAGIIFALAAVIGGFVIAGSPATQRALRFDSQRVSDLTNIQWQIVSYWQQNGTLPKSLAELSDSISGYIAPVDPDTDSAYDYIVPTMRTFKLCATFDLPTPDNQNRGAYQGGMGGNSVGVTYPSVYPGGDSTDNWYHAAGHVCFERAIDPTRYPVNPPGVPTPKGI